MKRKIRFDQLNCTGCRVCELICSFRHTDTFNPARSRVRISIEDEGGRCVISQCKQCKKPPCIDACPVDAISKDAELGIIKIDQEICIGCGECAEACPFGSIFVDQELDEMIVCDLCGGDPACVDYCVTNALKWVGQ